MFDINWIKNGPDSFHFVKDQYTLKKRQYNTGWVYSVWEHENMMWNSRIERLFLCLARTIMRGDKFNWYDYKNAV